MNETITPDPKKSYQLSPGDVVTLNQAGGGGFFTPSEREPELVLKDVMDGYVSMEAAEKIYAVVINPSDMTVDREATRKLRAGL